MSRTTSRPLARTVIALAIAATSSAALGDPIIWSQPEVGGGNASLFSSENDTAAGGSGNFSTVYDDFLFANGATITDVHWTGGYFDGNEANGNATGFTITFWSDAAGTPGSSLLSEHFNGNAGQGGAHTCLGNPCFTYQIDPLTTAFVAAPATPYWISIVADQGFPPNWGLAAATGGNGNGTSVQDFFGSRVTLSNDIAFDLSGIEGPAQAPEPATLALLGLGLAGLGFARRRKAG